MTTYITCPKTDNRIPILACESKCKPKKWARFTIEKCPAYKEAMGNKSLKMPKFSEFTEETEKINNL